MTNYYNIKKSMKQDNPLFVAKDVATVLGYSDTTNAIKQHCKGVAKHHPIADRMGRCQEMRLANRRKL